jgi:NAD(P)-dependent dehydrogenase (short-subunit alcohol dehydrogenase family)
MSDRHEFLSGRTALVTGAGRRLGKAVATALADAGADVVVHYHRSAEEAAAVASRIASAGRRAWTLQADLADPAAAASLMARAVAAAGGVDILVNSASVFGPSTVLDFTPQELAANVQVNAMAPLQLCRAFAAQQRPGDIVNFLDARVADYDKAHAAYHLSKRMLLAVTRMLALELAPRVKVNAVAPGLILPPPGTEEGYLADHAHTNPLHRHGTAEDITGAVLFLLRNGFVTGQVIYVDGGRHMKGCVHG